MKGRKTPPETVEEIKALSLVYSPQAVSEKTGVSLRTVYTILAKRDNPLIEARREEKRLEIVDEVWDDKKTEIAKLKTKMDMILDGLDQGKVDKARLTELSTSYGILFDKRQLMTGRPTENFNCLTKIIEAVHKRPPENQPPSFDKNADGEVETTWW